MRNWYAQSWFIFLESKSRLFHVFLSVFRSIFKSCLSYKTSRKTFILVRQPVYLRIPSYAFASAEHRACLFENLWGFNRITVTYQSFDLIQKTIHTINRIRANTPDTMPTINTERDKKNISLKKKLSFYKKGGGGSCFQNCPIYVNHSCVVRYKMYFFFQNNPKNLDPSYKTDLDFWDCFGRRNYIFRIIFEEGENPFYSRTHKYDWK